MHAESLQNVYKAVITSRLTIPGGTSPPQMTSNRITVLLDAVYELVL